MNIEHQNQKSPYRIWRLPMLAAVALGGLLLVVRG